MLFSYVGFMAFALVLTARAGANLHEIIVGIRKQGRLPPFAMFAPSTLSWRSGVHCWSYLVV